MWKRTWITSYCDGVCVCVSKTAWEIINTAQMYVCMWVLFFPIMPQSAVEHPIIPSAPCGISLAVDHRSRADRSITLGVWSHSNDNFWGVINPGEFMFSRSSCIVFTGHVVRSKCFKDSLTISLPRFCKGMLGMTKVIIKHVLIIKQSDMKHWIDWIIFSELIHLIELVILEYFTYLPKVFFSF